MRKKYKIGDYIKCGSYIGRIRYIDPPHKYGKGGGISFIVIYSPHARYEDQLWTPMHNPILKLYKPTELFKILFDNNLLDKK